MKATVRALLRGDSGQDLVEYSLLGALLSLVSLLSLQALGGIIRNEFFLLHFELTHFH
ncbi:MAG TPA: Flp family type IVb pilin [Candidatus Eisenbacteria bacterium]|jgi:Flp pilus assembly pilin Flp|nr:Flp family type IVb pilin [Candidatus Eisenbacteria bacterium]